jgi:branched-chain amino acid transport system ATP-binding protein
MPPCTKEETIPNFLEIEKLTKHFLGLAVLNDITLSLEAAEIVGLIGPNGAGKTTLFNVITGIYTPDSGVIRFQGKNLVGLKPHQICKIGIARTFQLVRIFPSMTVLDNALVGVIYGKSGNKKRAVSEAVECLELLGLLEQKDVIAAHLTYSDRKLLEIVRALGAGPSLTLLDEPLAGLNPSETRKIAAIIKELREKRELSILWIEHKMDAILNTCDRIIVLDYGFKIAEGNPKEIVNNNKVIEAYLGESDA